MKFTRVYLESIGYVLPPHVVTSAWIEEQLTPLYRQLHLSTGQLEALSGIRERRWWHPGHRNAAGAAEAARKALAAAPALQIGAIGALIYGGVCRDHFEPATACHVAAEIGLSPDAQVFDISNACLGVLNGIIEVAMRLELGQIKAGLVLSCESSREITMIMIQQMIRTGTIDYFKEAMATLTGGSGAVALLLTDGSFAPDRPRLLGGLTLAATEFHHLCRWGLDMHLPPRAPQIMETDAVGMLKHGGELIRRIGMRFWQDMGWTAATVDRLIAHQMALTNREAILSQLGIARDRDFNTFPYLGNMGTVSLPVTAAIAAERGVLQHGQRVVFVGVGSGLNSMMLGWNW